MAVLAIYLIFTSVHRAILANNYAEARNQSASCIETQIAQFLRAYDSLSLAGADIENDLLPDLHTYFYAMKALDDSLTYSFGSAYTILSEGLRSQIDSALSAYDDAYRTGKSTDSAYESLTDCINSLNSLLNERFTASGEIRPAK